VKASQIKRLLPSTFQRAWTPASPLAAVLALMEDHHTPAESVLSQLNTFFDPRRAPDAFVPYLASWVDLEILLDLSHSEDGPPTPALSTGVGRLRELVANAAMLSHWRGTRTGMRLFLETAVGITGFDINEAVTGPDGRIKPFHLMVTAPEEVLPHRSLIQRIIEFEKPAYVTYDLVFRSTTTKPATN
jgi:phage tail-like protein